MTDPNGTYQIDAGTYTPGPVPPWPLTRKQVEEALRIAAETWPPPPEVLDQMKETR